MVRLKAAGARLVVVTNQSGIARGLITTRQLEAIHARLRTDLAGRGVELDGLYVCPHHPDDGCACRKPRTGMVEQSRRESNLNTQWEYVIGDAERDVELGRRIGARTVRILSGSSDGVPTPPAAGAGTEADCVAPQFAEAVAWILEDVQRRRGAEVAMSGRISQ